MTKIEGNFSGYARRVCLKLHRHGFLPAEVLLTASANITRTTRLPSYPVWENKWALYELFVAVILNAQKVYQTSPDTRQCADRTSYLARGGLL